MIVPETPAGVETAGLLLPVARLLPPVGRSCWRDAESPEWRDGGYEVWEIQPAIAMIHEATVGAMRDIDRIATACCLKETHKKKRALVEREVVARVIAADAGAAP
jgi:hypothetical protein